MISRFRTARPARRGALLAALLAAQLIWWPATSGAQSDAELAAIRKRLADANAQTERVLNEIKSLDREIFAVNRAISEDEQLVASAEARIRSAETSIAEIESRMAEVRRSANARAVRMYKSGPGSILAPLFTAASFADLPKLGMFWESLAEHDGRTVAEANELREQRDFEKAELAETVSELEARVAELDGRRDGLRQVRERRAGSLQDLRAAIQEAMDAEQRVLAARAAAVKQAPAEGSCRGGIPARDERLAAVLAWYSPATGPAGFVPSQLSSTGVVTTGDASWYGPGFDGCRSASGTTFRASQMTAASLSLPMGTFLKVVRGGRAVVVVITDRGPYAHGRVLDLSQAAAQAIGLGAGPVSMEILLPQEAAPPFP